MAPRGPTPRRRRRTERPVLVRYATRLASERAAARRPGDRYRSADPEYRRPVPGSGGRGRARFGQSGALPKGSGQRLGPAQAASASARPFAERGFGVPGLATSGYRSPVPRAFSTCPRSVLCGRRRTTEYGRSETSFWGGSCRRPARGSKPLGVRAFRGAVKQRPGRGRSVVVGSGSDLLRSASVQGAGHAGLKSRPWLSSRAVSAAAEVDLELTPYGVADAALEGV
jgi:hypothetical protein